MAYVWYFSLIAVVQYVVQDVDIRTGLYRDAGSHAMIMYVLDHFLWVCLLVRFGFGRLGGRGTHCSLVMETVKITSCLLKVFDPLLGLLHQSAGKL